MAKITIPYFQSGSYSGTQLNGAKEKRVSLQPVPAAVKKGCTFRCWVWFLYESR